MSGTEYIILAASGIVISGGVKLSCQGVNTWKEIPELKQTELLLGNRKASKAGSGAIVLMGAAITAVGVYGVYESLGMLAGRFWK